jgi:hypothetical protein
VFRETDLRDARSVMVRHESRGLDWHYIEANLAGLAELKDDRALLPRLRSLRESCRRSGSWQSDGVR